MKAKLLSMAVCSLLFTAYANAENSQANEWKIQNDPYYKHKVSQFDMLKNESEIKVMMLGDSITDEAEWSELLGQRVQNRGISGDTTSGVLDRLHTIPTSIKQVFIMIGVNDIMRGKDEDYVFENYKKIIKFFQDRDVDIVIQSTLFIGEKRKDNFNPKIKKLNNNLFLLAKKNNIKFVDLNKFFSQNDTLKDEFSYDNLHLNGSAYNIWAKEIKNYLLYK